MDSALFLSPPGNWGGVVGAMKPGSHLLLFSNINEHHVGAIAAEDAGLEIRDTLAWVFSDDSNDTAMQLIAMARKPLQGTVAENTLKYGTGGINVDKCRIGLQPEENVEKLNKRSGGVRGFGSASVYGEGTTGPGTDLSKGRWPSNLVHDNSPKVRGMFPCNNGSQPRVTKRSPDSGNRTGYGTFAGQPEVTIGYGDSGSVSRFFYSTPGEDTNHLVRYLLRLTTPPEGKVMTLPQDYRAVREAAESEGFIAIAFDE